jgi:hypothetical protein
MRGVYQHCSEKHLARYLHEFAFRYSHRSALGIADPERATLAIEGATGKRLLYRQPRSQEAAGEIPFEAALAGRSALPQAGAINVSVLRYKSPGGDPANAQYFRTPSKRD